MVLRTSACCADYVELDNSLRWTSLRCSLSQTLVGEAQEKKKYKDIEKNELLVVNAWIYGGGMVLVGIHLVLVRK